MQVFKLYFKIIQKNIAMLSIYLVVFIAVTVIVSSVTRTPGMNAFAETKCKVAFINEDKASALVNGLRDYIGSKAELVQIENTRESLQDALFFREIEYMIRVPEGFTERFMSGLDGRLEKTSVPDSVSGASVDMLVTGYLNNVRLSLLYMPETSQSDLVAQVLSNLSKQTPVILKTYGGGSTGGSGLLYYFNYASYSVMIMLILGITSFMLVFNQTHLKQRTLCSPLKLTRMNLETILANLAFTVTVWFLILLACLLIFGGEVFSLSGLLWAINLFFLSVVGLSLSFLAGTLLKGKTAQSAVANSISLGFAFLSGSFIPQSLLGSSVLSVARFLPTYWYIKASDAIASLKTFNFTALKPIYICFLIQLGFAAALISVTLVISRQKRQGEGSRNS
jgi:ABC-2 type transport system permease protein